jgi:arsenate reductase
MKDRPSQSQLEALVSMLEDPVEDLVRKDSKFKKLGLEPADYVANAAAVVDVLERYPALLQRPIIVRGGRAIIGRPRDRVPVFLS